jgi:hypothetical protein
MENNTNNNKEWLRGRDVQLRAVEPRNRGLISGNIPIETGAHPASSRGGGVDTGRKGAGT